MSSTYSADVAVSLRCSNPTNTEITNALNNFIGKVSGGLGGALDLVNEIDSTVSQISDSVSGLTNQLSDLLQDKLVGFISTGLSGVSSFLFSQITSPIAALAQIKAFSSTALGPINGLFNAFGCLGANVKSALGSTLRDMLTNIVKNGILNPLQCAVEDFVGGIMNKVINVMDSIIGPLVNPINSLFSIIGQGFGSVKGFLAGGLNILNKVSGILNCANGGGGKCHVQNTYELNKGSKPQPSGTDNQNFISKAFDKASNAIAGIGTSIENLEGEIGKFKIFGSEVDDKEQLDCNSGNVLKCGAPKLQIFGGDGRGAVGEVILGNFIEKLDTQNFEGGVKEVPIFNDAGEQIGTQETTGIFSDIKTTASIIGVDITYPGEGYTEEPLVSFVDNCDQGYGAFGRAVIDKNPNSPTYGQLTDVIIISEGENYPADGIEDAFIEKIVIENGGSGYNMDDEIEDFEICGLDENGSITKVCVNDKVYRRLPSLRVKSYTGSGAILTPVMTRKRRQTEVIQVIDCITPKGNIVGYVNGKEYNGPFHVMPNGVKMTGSEHSDTDSIIYNTPQESLKSGRTLNTGTSEVRLRPIQDLIKESETTQTTESTDTYTDPVDDAMDTDTDMTPPSSTPPPSTPPSSPPSSPPSGGGGYGY